MSAGAVPGPGLRDALLESGLFRASGVRGLYHRSHLYEETFRGMERLLHAEAEKAGGFAPLVYFPPVMPRAELVQTDYLRSFPDLVGSVEVFRGDERAHQELIRRAEDDGPWEELLEPAQVTLCSAGCHSLYATLDPAIPADGLLAEIQGICFRHEPSDDPVRMITFRMHEYVFIGRPDDALAFRDRWRDHWTELLRSMGLPIEVVVANDPFFGRVGKMLARNQREEDLKYELVCPVSHTDQLTAITSANYHLDHLGAPFDLRTPDGEVAHSACMGFGIDRMTLALFATHGMDPTRWPREARDLIVA